MKIQCQNCGVEHAITPPSWVVSSGRAFRFRCSSCGYSQSVQPTREEEPPAPTPTPAAPTAGPTITPWESSPSRPEPVTDDSVEAPVRPDLQPAVQQESQGGAVFLKQNGQIYMVSSWEILKRWIADQRVDRHDLVSEGGVRWEPVGSRPDLLPYFASGYDAPIPEAAPSPFPIGGETPFGSSAPTGWHDDDTEGIPTGLPPLPTDEIPSADATGFDAVGMAAAMRKLTPTPPPVGRRRPPPVQRPFGEGPPVTPDRLEEPATRAPVDPESPTEQPSQPRAQIAPPALPETAPPAPPRPPPVATPAPSGPAPVPDADDFSEEEHFVSDPIYHPEDSDEEPLIVRRGPHPALYGLLGLLLLGAMGTGLIVGGMMWSTKPRPSEPQPMVSTREPTKGRHAAPTPSPDSMGAEPTTVGEGNAQTHEEAPASHQERPASDEDAPASVDEAPPVSREAPTRPPLPKPVVAPVPGPVPAKPVEVQPRTAPTPRPEPVASPPPRPAPKPVPKPKSQRVDVGRLVDQGWAKADSDIAGAKRLFKAALDASPNHVEAHYGYGYVLLSSGAKEAARPHLCVAMQRGSLDTRREARSLLTNNGLSCD